MYIEVYYRPRVGRKRAQKAIEYMLDLAWPLRLYGYPLKELDLSPNHLVGYEYKVGRRRRADFWNEIFRQVKREAIFLLDSRLFSHDELGMYRPCVGRAEWTVVPPYKIAHIISSHGIHSSERIGKVVLHEIVETHLVARSGRQSEHCTRPECILYSLPYPHIDLYPTNDEKFFVHCRKVIDGWKGLCGEHKSSFERIFFDM